MIRYKKYQVTGENSLLKGLWYARPVIEETFDIEIDNDEAEQIVTVGDAVEQIKNATID